MNRKADRKQNRVHASNRDSSRNRTEHSTQQSNLIPRAIECLIGFALIIRLLIPTESSVLGGTSLLTALWFAILVIWSWYRWRSVLFEQNSSVKESWQVDSIDLLLWIVIAGHLISAGSIWFAGGQKRLAINLMWEWIALGVSFFLIRQVMRRSSQIQQLLWIMIVTTITLSALGLWQHYVWFPQTARMYQTQRNELTELLNHTEITPLQLKRIQDIQQQFQQQGIPMEGPSRMLWEQRLLSSSEPFGTFALANVFAGLLMVWLLTLMGTAWENHNSVKGRRDLTFIFLGCLLIGFCLVLTKSRTAWLGFLVGVSLLSLLQSRWHPLLRKKVLRKKVLVLSGAGVVVACVLLLLSGSLDAEVLSESPKSLRYRLEYWTGSIKIIQEHFPLGVGPGNFRAHYLHYKPIASSEEIADPHNWLLDLWCSGGFLAVIGFIALLIVVAKRSLAWKRDSQACQSSTSTKRSEGWLTPLVKGAVLAFPFLWLFDLLFRGEGDFQFLILGLLWMLIALAFRNLVTLFCSPIVLFCSGVALMVHLTGAGGIEMPAIVQMMLVLIVGGFPEKTCNDESELSDQSDADVRTTAKETLRWTFHPRYQWSVVLICSLVCLIACLGSMVRPVLLSQPAMLKGDLLATRSMSLKQAESEYLTAATHDPYSPEPWQRLMGMYAVHWRKHRQQSPLEQAPFASLFTKAVDAGKEAIKRNPYSYGSYQQLAHLYLEEFRFSADPYAIQTAIHYFAEAVKRYPHYAKLRAEYALALQSAGEHTKATEEGTLALKWNEQNRIAGHVDRVLPSEIKQELEKILQHHK